MSFKLQISIIYGRSKFITCFIFVFLTDLDTTQTKIIKTNTNIKKNRKYDKVTKSLILLLFFCTGQANKDTNLDGFQIHKP
jgi:hypothetical protein